MTTPKDWMEVISKKMAEAEVAGFINPGAPFVECEVRRVEGGGEAPPPSDARSDANWILKESAVYGETLSLDLWYPMLRNIKEIEVGLIDVRAVDSIRIRFDYSRNGWVILQASKFEWEEGDEAQDADWQEVAFVQAWHRNAQRKLASLRDERGEAKR
jgi:hypothetical protein